ncbi:MAG: protein-L-isoaspartate(D-aspartate) O-methyltransferase [Cytophagales bacterium]|nr:MAG: protein-L-isoaspartate(D-aspartate) O-methyltransferase [Cytophagales bacterium]
MQDTYKTKGMRAALISNLREKGIRDERVLEAMGKVPRHFFLDSAFVNQAYQDIAFNIGEGQTISQPYTVAYQTSLLDVQVGDKILEIGTGSGYQSSVLIALGATLYTIEYNRKLYEKARALLLKMNYKGNFIHGDGSQGFLSAAPYNRILVTAGAPQAPQALLDQLKENGKLVIPIGDLKSQVMCSLTKLANGEIKKEVHEQFVFVPLLGKHGWKL